MRDLFLENEHFGVPARPTREQWSLRDEQLGRQKDAAVLNALKDTNSDSQYYLEYTDGYSFYFSLTEEMERCFRAGCWISCISMGAAAIDAFCYEYWGVTKAHLVEEKLKLIEFPYIGSWKLVRNTRNSIMHVNSKSDHDKKENFDLHYIARKTVWFAHYLRYYLGFINKQ